MCVRLWQFHSSKRLQQKMVCLLAASALQVDDDDDGAHTEAVAGEGVVMMVYNAYSTLSANKVACSIVTLSYECLSCQRAAKTTTTNC